MMGENSDNNEISLEGLILLPEVQFLDSFDIQDDNPSIQCPTNSMELCNSSINSHSIIKEDALTGDGISFDVKDSDFSAAAGDSTIAIILQVFI